MASRVAPSSCRTARDVARGAVCPSAQAAGYTRPITATQQTEWKRPVTMRGRTSMNRRETLPRRVLVALVSGEYHGLLIEAGLKKLGGRGEGLVGIGQAGHPQLGPVDDDPAAVAYAAKQLDEPVVFAVSLTGN